MNVNPKNKIIIFIITSMIMLLIGIYTYDNNEINTKDVELIDENVNVDNEDVEKYINVWTTSNVEIKKGLNENSESIGSYKYNVEIPVVYIDDNWAKIDGTEFYISRNYLSEIPVNFVNCDVPDNNGIKSYMDYECITMKSSDQYKLQHSLAYTGDNGLRMVNGRYCIAVGSYYTTKIGQYMDIKLENGNVIPAILADCKADIHTDSANRMNSNGSVIEFVVETDLLDKTAKKMGDISYVNNWNSKVVNIKVYDKIENFK